MSIQKEQPDARDRYRHFLAITACCGRETQRPVEMPAPLRAALEAVKV